MFSSKAPFHVWCVFAVSPGHRSELWGGLCGGGDTTGWQVLYPTGTPHKRWVTHLRSPLEGRGGLAWVCKITRTKGKYILSLRICIQVCFDLFCCGYTIIITHEFGGFLWLIPFIWECCTWDIVCPVNDHWWVKLLIHCGLVTPYGNTDHVDLGQYWLR